MDFILIVLFIYHIASIYQSTPSNVLDSSEYNVVLAHLLCVSQIVVLFCHKITFPLLQ